MATNVPKLTYSVPEVCEALQISRTTLWKLVRSRWEWRYIRDMASTSVNVGKVGIHSASTGNVLLSTRADLRILKVGFLTAALIAVAGAAVYLLPIDESLKVAFLPLAVLFVVILAYSVIMYEALGTPTLS